MFPVRLLRPVPRRIQQPQRFARYLSLETAASYCAKPADPQLDAVSKKSKNSPSNGLRWASRQFERWPAFSEEAGEDMFILEDNETDSSALLGVADGVGGWSLSGIDSSVFSKTLCYHIAGHYTTQGLNQDTAISPLVSLLEDGFDALKRDDTVLAGSSTACLVHLDAQAKKLQAANLGDSGFAVIRNNRVIHWQPSQTHFFNCPRQLSKVPEEMRTGQDVTDLPEHADTHVMELQAGDCIIVFTDGVIDNVFPREILALQQMFLSSAARKEHGDKIALKRFTNALVSLTWQAQRAEDRKSPFTLEARKHRKKMPGGKIDDIAVVSALVLP